MGLIKDWMQGRQRETQDLQDRAEQCAQAANRLLYKPHLYWLNDRKWLTPYSKFVDGQRILDRRFTLVQWASSVRRVAGSSAECGVYLGIGSALICKALEESFGEGECHFGFDSFEGLSQPAEVDRSRAPLFAPAGLKNVLRRCWKRGDLSSPQEVAQERLQEFDFCRLVKGWIPDCFSAAEEHRFRLVHIDVDLYQPTWDSLEFFYPRLNTGGVVVFDDYGLMTCPGARQAADDFFRNKPEPIVEIVTGQAVAVKQ